ncbi:hypothetical protein NDI39_16595 [Microcoleus sp. ZQ-A2]|nr:hypothetical protein [Microcoleus sp. FACHB-1]
MSGQYHKNPITKILSLVGVASASVCLSLPGFAQLSPNTADTNQPLNNVNSQTDSTMTDGQLMAQTMSGDGVNNTCGGYEGNATAGGGFYCARSRMSINGGNNSQYRMTPQGRSSTTNSPSTTGEGYPGTGVRPQGVDSNMNQNSNNSGGNAPNETPSQGGSNTNSGGSTTGEGFPGNGVRPQGTDKMNR